MQRSSDGEMFSKKGAKRRNVYDQGKGEWKKGELCGFHSQGLAIGEKGLRRRDHKFSERRQKKRNQSIKGKKF